MMSCLKTGKGCIIVHICHSQCFNEESQVFGGCQNTCLWVRNRLSSLKTCEPLPNNACRTKDSMENYVCSKTYLYIKLWGGEEKKHRNDTHMNALKM